MMNSFRAVLNVSRSKNEVVNFVDMSDSDQKTRIDYLWGTLRKNVKKKGFISTLNANAQANEIERKRAVFIQEF